MNRLSRSVVTCLTPASPAQWRNVTRTGGRKQFQQFLTTPTTAASQANHAMLALVSDHSAQAETQAYAGEVVSPSRRTQILCEMRSAPEDPCAGDTPIEPCLWSCIATVRVD
jgi:hypothetical protein